MGGGVRRSSSGLFVNVEELERCCGRFAMSVRYVSCSRVCQGQIVKKQVCGCVQRCIRYMIYDDELYELGNELRVRGKIGSLAR